MLKQGLIDEVKSLLVKYPQLTPESTSMRCVGYRQTLEHLSGDYNAQELLNRGIFATRQLAKRQLTWLRCMDDLSVIDCLRDDLNHQVLRKVTEFLA